jgi:hypothetical protein
MNTLGHFRGAHVRHDLDRARLHETGDAQAADRKGTRGLWHPTQHGINTLCVWYFVTSFVVVVVGVGGWIVKKLASTISCPVFMAFELTSFAFYFSITAPQNFFKNT